MVEKYINNPQDIVEEGFVQQESWVVNINYNVSLLMATLTNELELFIEDVGFNEEVKWEGRSGDQEEIEGA